MTWHNIKSNKHKYGGVYIEAKLVICRPRDATGTIPNFLNFTVAALTH